MAANQRQGVVSTAHVTEEEALEIRRLAAVCNAAEGLELKLAVDTSPAGADEEPDAFRAYADGALVGYCALDHPGGPEAELCGMVHPEHRRRGLGRALLAATREACARQGITRLLVICEAASGSGQGFVASIGARHEFTELHMEMELDTGAGPGPDRPAGDGRVQLRRAVPEDTEALIAITATAFDESREQTARRIAAGFQEPDGRFYVGGLAGATVGSLKVYTAGDKAGIYGFGVLPEHRGQGVGRQILTGTIAALRTEGWTRFALEVDPENAPAIALYRSCGFVETTTYGYYALEV